MSQYTNLILKIENRFYKNPFSITYGLGRTLIALSTLSVFLFNDISILYSEDALNVISRSDLLINKINFFGIFGYSNLIYAQLIGILIFVLVISGYMPQITGLLHFWVCFSFNNSAILLDGGEQIASIFTFLILPICLLDNRLNHWHKPKKRNIFFNVIGHLFFAIISLQTSFIYLNAAVEKLYRISEWKDGTALFYIFSNPMFGLPDFVQNALNFISQSKYILFLTWSVVLSHLLISYVLLLKRENKINIIFVGFFLHSGIAVLMGLYSFSLVMIGILVLYLVPFDYFEKIKKYGKL
jgi:antimicrobial peptide system SdpB family protein